jgi:predicted alpha/beta hydrolase family esterase
MARQILFVQGAGEGTHDRWDSKLVASLERELGDGYAVRYPRMPGEDDPSYPAWQVALAKEFRSLEDGAILVGHSLGGAFLIHMLAEQPPPSHRRFGGLLVVAAPFIGEGGWPGDGIGEFQDVSGRLPAGIPLFLYHGADDAEVPTAHVHLYAKALPHAVVRTLVRRDHQLNDDMSDVARDILSVG